MPFLPIKDIKRSLIRLMNIVCVNCLKGVIWKIKYVALARTILFIIIDEKLIKNLMFSSFATGTKPQTLTWVPKFGGLVNSQSQRAVDGQIWN